MLVGLVLGFIRTFRKSFATRKEMLVFIERKQACMNYSLLYENDDEYVCNGKNGPGFLLSYLIFP